MRTGYSCVSMRRKNKHGCAATITHWCSAKGIYIDPMSCNRDCRHFKTIASQHAPKRPEIDVVLL